jgi:excisionase family DNA binding protein
MATKKEKFLTIKETAKLLNIGERTIYRYIAAKEIKAMKIGFWRIDEKSVRDFVKRSSNLSK